jgi:hypothetical protein
MRKLVIACILLTIAFVVNATTISCAYAGTKADKKVVKTYVKKHYPHYKIKYCKNLPAKRKSKKKIYVLVVETQSEGKFGYTDEGYYVHYGRYIKKYSMVKSYFIYNPNNNEWDDIVNIVTKGKLKFK